MTPDETQDLTDEQRAWVEAKDRPAPQFGAKDAEGAAAMERILAEARDRGQREGASGGSLFDVVPDEDDVAVPAAEADSPDPTRVEPGGPTGSTTKSLADEGSHDRAAMAPRAPARKALGAERAKDNVTGKGPKAFGNPRPHADATPVDSSPPVAQRARGVVAAGALFDEGEYVPTRHPFESDGYGRCKTCGVLSDGSDGVHTPGLADKFLVPPFSVFNTREGYWQDRRRAWLSLGIRGETTTEEEYRPDGSRGSREDGVWMGRSTKPLTSERGPAEPVRGRTAAFNQGGNTGSRIVTTADRKPDEAQVGLGRSQGLIYQHDAPASDPSFYDKKSAVERELGRKLTTEEFKRDYYRREDQDLGQSQSVQTGTSVFDPVLCEIAYRWFSGEGAVVVDPFAGGVVRGLVAGVLGREYHGTELRPEQIADNRLQAEGFLGAGSGNDWGREPVMPTWYEHDATKIGELDLPRADLVFTCPPYADLEVYSDDPRDLSTKDYPDFIRLLGGVMEQTAAVLKPDRFAVWVVGEARGGKQTAEYGFVADTVKAAQAAGLALYNSAILLNSVGSAALRAQLIMRSRKLTRVHQHVLVFLKGDHKKAAAACGDAAAA